MLMALMAQMTAIHMRNNAMMGMMGINNARMGMLGSVPSFGGGMGMAGLAMKDNQMSMDMIRYNLMGKLAKAELEAIEKRQQQREQKGLDVIA